MHVTSIIQPYSANGQLAQLGAALGAELSNGEYSLFRCSVAFARSSGTSRLFGPLRGFVLAGGEARVYVGVRNGITSAQAVAHLLTSGAEVYGCDTGGSVLFHPKVYAAQGEGSAWIAVGSANLTCDGMYRNFEVTNVTRLALPADEALLQLFGDWFDSLHYTPRCIRFDAAAVTAAVAGGLLVDEAASPRTEGEGSRAGTRRGPPLFPLPPVPPPHPEAEPTAKRPRRRVRAPIAATAAGAAAERFAMTLSAFDCSHGRGTPGTPEISLPEDAAPFFPTVALQGRKYPDAYFQVVLNGPSGTIPVTYRIWHRPHGTAEGHADWRINVKHETIDLTRQDGGDVILFERRTASTGHAYEVWVVSPSNPTYDALSARCITEVEAAGQAGTKRYGFF